MRFLAWGNRGCHWFRQWEGQTAQMHPNAEREQKPRLSWMVVLNVTWHAVAAAIRCFCSIYIVCPHISLLLHLSLLEFRPKHPTDPEKKATLQPCPRVSRRGHGSHHLLGLVHGRASVPSSHRSVPAGGARCASCGRDVVEVLGSRNSGVNMNLYDFI